MTRGSAIIDIDDLRCQEILSDVAGITDNLERHQRLSAFLRGQPFATFLRQRYGYLRGNLFVVSARETPQIPPIHWHWIRDPLTLRPRCLLEDTDNPRIALPFLDENGKPSSDDERRRVESVLVKSLEFADPAALPTSSRLIRAMRAKGGRAGFLQEVTFAELLFFLSIVDGGYPPHSVQLDPDTNAARIAEWIRNCEQRPTHPAMTLVSMFGNLDGLKDSQRWKEASRLLASSSSLQASLRFFVGTPGIRAVQHILCFRAGHVYSHDDLQAAYCLLELSSPLEEGNKVPLTALFSSIAQVGALSTAVIETFTRRIRHYMHSFDKPLGTARMLLAQSTDRSGGVIGPDDVARVMAILENLHIAARSVLDRADAVSDVDLVADVVEPIATFHNSQFSTPIVAWVGDRVVLRTSRDHLYSIMLHLLDNALFHGDRSHGVTIRWRLSPPATNVHTSPRSSANLSIWILNRKLRIGHSSPGLGTEVVGEALRRIGGSLSYRDGSAYFCARVRLATADSECLGGDR